MKKYLYLLVMAFMIAVPFASCSNNDKDEDFDYSIEALHGTWTATEIKNENGSMNLDGYWYTAVFNPDGTFKGEMYHLEENDWGGKDERKTIYGTYKAAGDMIYLYDNGKEYGKCKVLSLNGSEISATITIPSLGTVQVKASKSNE